MKYNPEKRAWRGKSYKKHGLRVRDLRDAFRDDDGESFNKFEVELDHVQTDQKGL